ncbi:phytanoyl-CoA dioxygenase family protein [Pseudoalteromonas sp. MMG013]|uniref:phytanoyl-CoA dioxygenase family protein n=1 Tax=Pseudoalteromonas sp. MMG013 TaxID=2822687 RepID=UPI001B37C661|nr:phytanoyl-CoA dioxygenase family protein [Pseudoalteromonas sp. MMG013]MBQ4860695.1 phytanoyl-CoA dioxygenase family protein [Pseudoalteromonas sp. MMG013]
MNHKEEFEKKGYIAFNNASLNISMLEQAKLRISHLLASKYETGVKPWSHFGDGNSELTRLSQIHMCDSIIYKTITQSKIGELAAEITGARNIKIWGCQLFHKPHSTGLKGNVGFHRDSQHMPFFKKGVLTAWLPLNTITHNNGPLMVVNGSHKWPKTLINTGGDRQDIAEQVQLLRSYYTDHEWNEDAITLELGGISFHNFEALHGSYPNRTEADRSVITIGLFTEDVQLNNGVDDYGYGLILNDERFCPTIFSKETY